MYIMMLHKNFDKKFRQEILIYLDLTYELSLKKQSKNKQE